MTPSATRLDPRVAYTLMLGDDSLVLAQRLAEWLTRAPELEEDVALANITLDLLGQARTLLRHAGDLEGAGRDEDSMAYLRDDRDFRNVLLVECPNGDFAETMARLLAFSSYQYELYSRLTTSSDSTLAAIAAKAVKEVTYHRDHATQWTVRLGDGTTESHRRMQAGVDAVWPYVAELFDVVAELPDVAVDPSELREPWTRYVDDVLRRATLTRPDDDAVPSRTGGRRGLHTEHLGFLLAEMQHLHRSHPGVTW